MVDKLRGKTVFKPPFSSNFITIWILCISCVFFPLCDTSGSPLYVYLINILNCRRIDGDSSVPTSWDAIFDCIPRGMFLRKWKRQKISWHYLKVSKQEVLTFLFWFVPHMTVIHITLKKGIYKISNWVKLENVSVFQNRVWNYIYRSWVNICG